MHPQSAARILALCRADPVYFAEHILGVPLYGKQREILEAVRDNKRVAIRAARGVGKTFVAAIIVLWFLYCHPASKVITTAPTQHQVRNLLWMEINALHKRADDRGYPLGGEISSVRLHLESDWFAVGLSSNDPKNYLGFHAPAILFLVDEASGVPQAILDAAKGYGTGALSRTLYLANPTQTSGGVYDAFHGAAAMWHGMRISTFDSPNFTEAAVAKHPRVAEYMQRKGIPYSTEHVSDALRDALPRPEVVDDALIEWGEEHPLFAVYILGNFPTTGLNNVIGLQAVVDAQSRYNAWEPTEGVDTCDLVCDVARFGDDETALGVREHGDIDRMTIRETWVGQDTMRTTGEIVDALRVLEDPKGEHRLTVKRIVVDDAGVGGGVVDRLRELQREGTIPAHVQIVAYNGGARPRTPKEYPNARSEGWFHFATELADIALDPSPKLLADLVAPTYELDSKGRRVVEQKKVTKKRLGRSPDRADTALMAFAPSGVAAVGRKSKRKVYGSG